MLCAGDRNGRQGNRSMAGDQWVEALGLTSNCLMYKLLRVWLTLSTSPHLSSAAGSWPDMLLLPCCCGEELSFMAGSTCEKGERYSEGLYSGLLGLLQLLLLLLLLPAVLVALPEDRTRTVRLLFG